jgi:hypothetical protein
MLRDIIEQNEDVKVNSREVQLLKEHFGGCFNNEGKFDLEKFRTMIGDEINIIEENQGFNFLGKSYARMITGQESLTVIRPDDDHNSKPENRDSENIYISGDNLDALKHLCKSYSKQVKCIYIDPPYNTGSDGFVYNDKFDFKAEELSSKLGINLEQAEHIIDMKKSSSASDAAWLTFMLPRLELAKDMLSKDGVIFISIDDNEQANLKLLCDEIFGVENFLANLTRRTKSGGGSAADAFAVENDYILAYARDAEQLGSLYIPYTEEYLKRYKEEDEIGKFFWDTMSRSCTGTKPYQIEAPDGTMLDGNWFKSETTYLKDKDAGDTRIIKKPDGTWSVQFKQRIAEGKKLRSILIEEFIRKDLLGNEFKSTQEDLEKLGMEGLFSNPKTVFLLNYLLQLISGDNNYIMDFFSGSATTAEAVFQSNIALTKKNRFIMIQLPEDLDESVQRTSGATKETIERDINFLEENHYPHTLDFIGFERIKRAAKQIAEANPLFKGDLGFKHYTLESFEPDTIDRLYDFDMNSEMNDNDILSKFGAKTVLTTWLCRDGYGLNPKVSEVKLKDYTAYLCGKHLYLLDADFYQDEMAELIDKMADATQNFNPDVIVVFGYGMGYSTRLMLDKNLRALADARGNKISLDVRY